MKRILKHPEMTTTWPLNDRINVEATVDRLAEKLFVYNTLSRREREYFERHNKIKIGKIKVAKL